MRLTGQFGPTKRLLLCVFSAFVTIIVLSSTVLPPKTTRTRPGASDVPRTISCWGMPSVIQTIKGISASKASSIPAAASGGGTKMTLALAPVSFTPSETFLKTGRPRCVVPASTRSQYVRILLVVRSWEETRFWDSFLQQPWFHTRLLAEHGRYPASR